MSRKRAYERLPHEVTTALGRGDLTLRQYGLLCYLISKADYQVEGPPEYSIGLAGLAERLSWDESLESLRRGLRRLKTQGWIDYRARTGPRNIYVIQLLPRASMRDSLPNRVPNRVSISSANPHGYAEVETPTTPTPTPTTTPTSVDVDSVIEEELEPPASLSEVDRLLDAVRPEDREATGRVFWSLRAAGGCTQADFERAREDVLQFDGSIADRAAYAVARLKEFRSERAA